MKIRADEHVAEAIIRAVREIALRDGWTLDSVVSAEQAGKPDVHWITEFMLGGGDAILSADRDFLENPPQVAAVFRTGAKVIHLPPKWGQAKGALQSAHILMWWARIEACIVSMKPRQCYRPPWNINETGELQAIAIDFQAAHKKLKKANRKQKSL
ncbi:hypothetical protein [Sphingomonas sp. 35-24ZXX]|uniref:PIN-like domain-containing protein n=1 Tax=Sphingomonas sp. 35-24ZXX TaxID=1545915 RepID=UPI00053BE34B|nr:hypothetical protein [Sphingomonas sp. 35-24ZXX]